MANWSDLQLLGPVLLLLLVLVPVVPPAAHVPSATYPAPVAPASNSSVYVGVVPAGAAPFWPSHAIEKATTSELATTATRLGNVVVVPVPVLVANAGLKGVVRSAPTPESGFRPCWRSRASSRSWLLRPRRS
jgi:hypothetical protein